MLPETASVRADAFEVPSSLVHLEQYENLSGTLRADWSTSRFRLDLKAILQAGHTNCRVLNILVQLGHK